MTTMRDPTISIVMAVHNGERTIRRAVESVQSQTLVDWELILFDDGSSDATRSLLQSLAAEDHRLKLVLLDHNEGLASCLNRGIDLARSDLVARMDADDVSYPERLDRQVQYLRAHTEVDVLGTAVDLVDDDGAPLGTGRPPATHDRLAKAMYRSSPFYHPTVVYRRAWVVRWGGYDSRLRRGQDQDLWLRTYQHSTFANLTLPLLRHAVRGRPSWRTSLFGSRVLFVNACRERRPVAKGKYAGRYLVATVGLSIYDRAMRLRPTGERYVEGA